MRLFKFLLTDVKKKKIMALYPQEKKMVSVPNI